MESGAVTLLGLAAGIVATLPLALALWRSARPDGPNAMVLGVVCVIASFVLAQGALAVAYVVAPAHLARFGVPCALSFLATATLEALLHWRRPCGK